MITPIHRKCTGIDDLKIFIFIFLEFIVDNSILNFVIIISYVCFLIDICIIFNGNIKGDTNMNTIDNNKFATIDV